MPIPPSKMRGDPDYDDRITQICCAIPASFELDIRELVVQTESTGADHESGTRRTTNELLAIYRIDEFVATPLPERIVIVGDVLTNGTHFRAMNTILANRFPNVPIVGFFVARRIFLSETEDGPRRPRCARGALCIRRGSGSRCCSCSSVNIPAMANRLDDHGVARPIDAAKGTPIPLPDSHRLFLPDQWLRRSEWRKRIGRELRDLL